MLKLTELAVLAITAEMPVVAHLLTGALHALVKGSRSASVTCWQWLIQSLFVFVVISIFLLFVLCSRCNGDVAIWCSTSFTDRGWRLLAALYERVLRGLKTSREVWCMLRHKHNASRGTSELKTGGAVHTPGCISIGFRACAVTRRRWCISHGTSDRSPWRWVRSCSEEGWRLCGWRRARSRNENIRRRYEARRRSFGQRLALEYRVEPSTLEMRQICEAAIGGRSL